MPEDYPDSVEYETKDGSARGQSEPDPDAAEHDLLAIVADLEHVPIDELPSFYREAGHFVAELFETPPSDGSQMEITFSYAGYRVTINRKGDVKLVDVKRTAEEE